MVLKISFCQEGAANYSCVSPWPPSVVYFVEGSTKDPPDVDSLQRMYWACQYEGVISNWVQVLLLTWGIFLQVPRLGKKKVVNETLKHAKYCREAYQWSIYRLKKKKSGFWIYKTWFPPSALRAHRFVTKPLHSFITNSSLWMLNWLIRLFYPMNEILPLSQIGTPLFFPLIFS